jgi:hypothetical protein
MKVREGGVPTSKPGIDAGLGPQIEAFAVDLAGTAWRTKPEREWTPVERAAYERWAREELAEIAERSKRGEQTPIGFMTHEEGLNAVGEFVRITLKLDTGESLSRDDVACRPF